MKKTMLVLLVLVVAVAMMAAAPAFTKLARLTVWNRTGKDVKILLTYTGSTPSADLHYYLTVRSSDTPSVFTVERKTYAVKYWACDGSASGNLEMSSALKLTFTSCDYAYTDSTVKWSSLYSYLVGWDVNGKEVWAACDGTQPAGAICKPSYNSLWWTYKFTGLQAYYSGNPDKVIHDFDYQAPGEPTFEKVHLKQPKPPVDPSSKCPWGSDWRLTY